MRKLAIVLATSATMAATPALAEQYYGFANVSINYLDWSDKTEDRTDPDIGGFGGAKEDFFYIEVEGGAGFDWGDVYGFIDFENPQNSRTDEDDKGDTDGFRIAAKGSVAVNIGESNWNYYGHIYSFTEASGGFYDQNVVLGVSYDLFTESGLWIKPFIGVHVENQTFAGSGMNGFMAGYVLGYDFMIGEEKFAVTQWHETEFGRDDQFRNNGTQYTINSVGHNGAVSLWWHTNKKLTLGLQYRYADHKLGTSAYQDAAIVTAKYNF
ncbi:outer membrane protein OmpK [Thalassotalea sp. Y01]|uniref:outer membrane protein OmpK n=1 Tax=Thalassotalea sp. Y01 TaxID=2729613 RepID=UPI00145EF173|nr:outer membrane protein OmpK [Thalassotalea sp. Y01]NMP15730.1 ion channel protein Tsx [Thalassotalea sp. Y01]